MMKGTMSALVAATLGLSSLPVKANVGLDRSFDIVNRSNNAIFAVRASHIDRNSFGTDLLGAYVVQPGQWMHLWPVRHQGYCRFDVQIVFDNGDVQNIWDVNLCEASQLVIYG